MGVVTETGRVRALRSAPSGFAAPSSRESHSRRRRGDLIALGVLIGVPLAVFAIPAAVGFPLLTGDNVIQNYPLRVLAGEILAHGHLPIYNPFAWGGSPLLASANATVAFPDIALFAFLPGIVAWVGVEVLAFGGAAVGLFCFLRCEGLDPLPAGIGGAIYGLGGYVSSQAVHLDVVQTAASLAWVLVGLQRIGRGSGRHVLAWTAFLAVAVGAAGLAGNPESEFYAALGAAIYAISLVISAERRLLSGALIVLGAIVGSLIAALQVLPADRFVAISQRAAVPFGFLTQGSVRPAELSLVVLPHLLGGGLIGLRHYVGGANFAEIDVSPGLVALTGTVALAFSYRSPEASRIRVWYLIGAIGLLVALGPATFLPHVLRHLPVVGMSRLPSRALILAAASFAVFGGFWSAEFLEPGSTLPRRAGAVGSARRRVLERWSVLLPALAVAGLAAAVAVGGRPLARAIAGRDVGPWTLARVAPYLGAACTVALVAGVVFIGGWRLSRHGRSVALVSVVALDLLLFTANQTSLAPIRSNDVGRPNRYEEALRRVVGANGRFVVVDQRRNGQFVLNDLGAPNLNVFYKISSAQGYGSLTWEPYADATGTHAQDTASPSAFATPVFDSLDVRALLALPSSFESAARGTGGDAIRVRSSARTTRYFGAFIDVRSICVGHRDASVRSISTFESRIRFVDGHGSGGIRFSDDSCGVRAQWVHAVRAVGIVFPDAPRGVTSIEATVTTARHRTFGLDGPLSKSVTSPHWDADGRIGPYFVFRDASAMGPFTAVTPDHRGGVRLFARVVSSSPWSPTETVAVTAARTALLVRDVAALPGWSATIDHEGRKKTVVPGRDGVVQQIPIPAGTSVVTYRYDPPGLSLGEGLAAAGVVAVLVLIALDRRRGRAPTNAAGGAPRSTPVAHDGMGDPTG
jgi:hypothetical protein